MLDVVILAAGQGTRMKSKLPKVLHLLGGKPLVSYSIDAATAVSGKPPVLVVGHGGDQVREQIGTAARFVEHSDQLGTGHAVMQTRSLLEGKSEHVLVTYADMPLLQGETLETLYEHQKTHAGPISMLTVIAESPRGFGRIVRNSKGAVTSVVEESHATSEQLAIQEVNVGIYCFDAAWLWKHLDAIPLNTKGEYYLTDLIEMAVAEGASVNALPMKNMEEAIGINTRVHLAEAEAILRRRVNEDLMNSGVTILDPATTTIHPTVRVGRDTVIHPNTCLYGETHIGENCVVGPNTVIEDCTIGSYCTIIASVLEQAIMEDHVEIGPFGHLRKGAYLEEGVHMGNFGEVKNSRLRQGTKMGHFSYIGDADIGEETNIGAGTITANYDGVHKHKTVTGKRVFIGSDTMLVAPVELGDDARTAAGSVVTHDVPPGTLVVGVPARPRPPQPEKNKRKG